ncbi:sulfurtransferase TusA family protein [Pelistega sp. NLN82]|uniref:Sulfurtransferase TusA family protein n=1 Tax=Pelistega ratti TaxID=2652177 RepID=A0A6L9Y7Q3_9BURK|nr:sulfurtransferase TusA family protein [Pelistega ratti]NEN76540.1 sulfurtransferase TusA family protein [Pelistega ratti]
MSHITYPEFVAAIDTSGLTCPLPLLRTKKALQTVESGQVLKVLTTDPSAVGDFQAFAKQTGHIILLQAPVTEGMVHFIQKR